MKRVFVLIFPLLVTFSQTSFSSPSSGYINDQSSKKAETLLSITGSNTIGARLAPALAKGYLKHLGGREIQAAENGMNQQVIFAILPQDSSTQREKKVRIDIAAHGSSTGFAALKTQTTDIAAASRPAKNKEIESLRQLTELTSRASEHILGIDGLAIIINPQNPIEELSVDQVSAIFSGEISNWSELGGGRGKINLYARDDKSGTWDSFKGMVLGKSKLSIQAQRFESNDRLSDRVSADINGIGFVGLPSVRQSKLIAISAGQAKALEPNNLTISTEDYALSRRLYFYTDDEPKNPQVKSFIKYSLSAEGQKIVADNGFIAQDVEIVEPVGYDDLPTDFKELVPLKKRLTVNFRFKQGSATLDNRAMMDIERLAKFSLEHPEYKLILIGFGDYRKSHERSKLLSKLRAMAVRRELVRLGVYPKANYGYGGQLPVASNERDAGRFKNRRVEVWLGGIEK